jgi:hypothetical protein
MLSDQWLMKRRDWLAYLERIWSAHRSWDALNRAEWTSAASL